MAHSLNHRVSLSVSTNVLERHRIHTTYGGHFGMRHTHHKIQLHYFWPGMSDFIRDKITACHKCVSRKSPVNRHQPMGHVPVSGKFDRVAMDMLDVSVISGKGHKYILVVCDYFTKYTEAYPLADKTARSVADTLMDKWLPHFGFPLFLHSNQRKQFDNAMVHKLSELLGMVKTKMTPYHPRSDGLVERFNRTQCWPCSCRANMIIGTICCHL